MTFEGSVDYPAFRFVESEKAQQLKNSRGGEKSRLHLLSYKGDVGKDRYAIAAKIITFQEGEEPKLDWRDRRFNVLHKHVDEEGVSTWYKINKNSLEKRLGITVKELGLDKETGLVGNELEELVKVKQKNLDDLIGLANPKNVFETRLVHGLAEAGLTGFSFEQIHLFPIRSENDKIETDHIRNLLARPDFHMGLVVPYLENDISWASDLDIKGLKPAKQMLVDHSSYKRILSGEIIPDKVLSQLNEPLGLPKGKIQFNIQNRQIEHKFNSKTRPDEIRNWAKELKDAEGEGRVLLDSSEPGKYLSFDFPIEKSLGMFSYQPILFFIEQTRNSDDIVSI